MEKNKDYINGKFYEITRQLRVEVAIQDRDSVMFWKGVAYGYLDVLLNLDAIRYGEYVDALDIVDAIASNKRKDVPKCIIV